MGFVSQAAMIGDMVNQSFEDGITGWTVSGNASATVIQSYAPLSLTPYDNLPIDSGGSYFVAIQKTGGTGAQGISQTFNVSLGETVYGWYALNSGGGTFTVTISSFDMTPPGNVVSTASSTTPGTWVPWSWTATGDGSITLQARMNGAGTALFDMSAIPEARGWLMGGALALVLGAVELLRRRRQQTA